MSTFHHYELLCDAAGCSATCNVGEALAMDTRRRAAALGWTSRVIPAEIGFRKCSRHIDLCPAHAGADTGGQDSHLPAGEPLPAVCTDEVFLPVEVLREIRDCLAERGRWFETRGRAVPAETRAAIAAVDEAVRYASGAGRPEQ